MDNIGYAIYNASFAADMIVDCQDTVFLILSFLYVTFQKPEKH